MYNLFINFKTILLILSIISYPIHAIGLWGKLETNAQLDNHYGKNDIFMEQFGEFQYQDAKLNNGLSYALRTGISGIEAQFYQAYTRKKWHTYQLTAGRFEQADLTGFYTLDGIGATYKKADVDVNVYAGQRKRIELFDSISEQKYLVGIDSQFSLPFNLLDKAKLGMQHYAGGQQRVNFGLTGVANQDLKWSTDANYNIENKKLDNFLFNANSKINWRERSGLVGITYETYQHLTPQITFRERFYRLYAKGRQSGLKTYAIFEYSPNQQIMLEGRKLWRDFGSSGYAASVGLRHKRLLETRVDVLLLGDEKAINWFVTTEKPLSSRMVAELSCVVQWQDTSLFDNKAVGLANQINYMLNRDLFINVRAEYVFHTEKDDEYQLGVRLKYAFYGR
ncbi:hypothetical protein QUF74_12110 [Candidatus Halobeggiatoa sp. HSG11]|nr:hypothetical protein [Candidatus Halobeggiatoa sp. HSG11]